MHKVYLKPGKEESLKRFHPWIFSGAIARFDGEPEEGEVVEVYTSKKEFIAEGHFQIGSIAVRVLSFRQEPIDHDFWKRKLQIAYDMRCGIGIAVNPTNDTYRLVHGEGDNLPGLVIDIYARTAVMHRNLCSPKKTTCRHAGALRRNACRPHDYRRSPVGSNG